MHLDTDSYNNYYVDKNNFNLIIIIINISIFLNKRKNKYIY